MCVCFAHTATFCSHCHYVFATCDRLTVHSGICSGQDDDDDSVAVAVPTMLRMMVMMMIMMIMLDWPHS